MSNLISQILILRFLLRECLKAFSIVDVELRFVKASPVTVFSRSASGQPAEADVQSPASQPSLMPVGSKFPYFAV